MKASNTEQMNHATRVVASTLGVLVGLAGINHGIFEILQGNVYPQDFMIAAIGPAQRFWEHGEETALTIIPNFLVTGILAVIFGILIMIWAIKFIDKRYGAGILFLLGIILFLFGGGFAPIFMTIIASLAASQINKPLKFWRKILPEFLRQYLAKLWLGTLITFVAIFTISVIIAIFGWPLTTFYDADTAFDILNKLSYIMLGFMLLAHLTALAHDVQLKLELEQ
jgi:hypothetical protein